MADSEQFLTIAGVWTSDDRIELQSSYLTSEAEGASQVELQERDRLLLVEFVDGQGDVIGRQPIASTPLCAYPGGSAGEMLVADKIHFPEETRTVRFVRADTDTVIHEIERPAAQPEVNFDWEPRTDTRSGRETISWTAQTPMDVGRPLQFVAFYSHDDGASWQPLTLPSDTPELELDLDELPGGENCRVKVLATDGVNTAEAQSPAFRVQSKGYRAMILSPEEDITVVADQGVWLIGQGYHLEEQRTELADLSWASSIDGPLGVGHIVEARLSPGLHEVMLRVGDDTASITLNVVNS